MTTATSEPEASEGLDQAETLKGDIRDRMIALFKDEAQKPWPELNEKEQTRIADRCADVAEALIMETIGIVHAEGAPSMRMVVGKVAFGKGVSAQLTSSKSEENRHLLADLADGAEVIVVMENVHRYMGERAPAAIDPDQTAMDVSPTDEHGGDGDDAAPAATKRKKTRKAATKKAAVKKVDPTAVFKGGESEAAT